jgi:hypothetical protein
MLQTVVIDAGDPKPTCDTARGRVACGRLLVEKGFSHGLSWTVRSCVRPVSAGTRDLNPLVGSDLDIGIEPRFHFPQEARQSI